MFVRTNEIPMNAANTLRVVLTAKRAASASMVIALGFLGASIPVLAQNSGVQDRLAMVKMAMADNAQKLHHYQWIETTQATLNGEARPPQQESCQYGPDGTVQKTPIGPPPAPPSGGPLRQRLIERKQAEMKEYMAGVKSLLAQYLPPDPRKMEQVKQAGNFSLTPGQGAISLVFKNYAQAGDQMTLTFDIEAKRVAAVSVNTYFNDPQDVVTLQVQMASLPDGTNYAQQTTVNATAKNLVVVTTNSNYQRLGGS
jgi:hypothetical protein